MSSWSKNDVCEVIGHHSGECVGLYLMAPADEDEAMAAFRDYAAAVDLEIPTGARSKVERWRKVPARKGKCHMLFVRGARGQGAFPVTHLELSKW
jgi:hypothetical protein